MKLDEIDHLRLRAACAEEALAQRAAADATAAREQVQTAITSKYDLCERDRLDVQTGEITKGAPLTVLRGEQPAS